MDDNLPIIFTGPAVFTITDPLDTKVLNKFTKLYNKMLCGDITEIRIYVATTEATTRCLNIMADMINIQRYNTAIVVSGLISSKVLSLLTNTNCTALALPSACLGVYPDVEVDLNAINKEYKLWTKKELNKLNEYPENIFIEHEEFMNKIMAKRVEKNPKEEDLMEMDEELSEIDLLALQEKVDTFGFLEDDADLSEQEFEKHITDSFYGKYTKKDLEEFKEILIQKGLYHRIKIVDKLLNLE